MLTESSSFWRSSGSSLFPVIGFGVAVGDVFSILYDALSISDVGEVFVCEAEVAGDEVGFSVEDASFFVRKLVSEQPESAIVAPSTINNFFR